MKDDLPTCCYEVLLIFIDTSILTEISIKCFHTAYPGGPQHCYMNALEKKRKETANESEA